MARIVKVFADAAFKAARAADALPGFDIAAARVLARVEANAAPHIDSGDYVGSIRVRTVRARSGRGIKDRLVYADDNAIIPIEFGHVAPNGEWVEGQFIMIDAYDSFPKTAPKRPTL